MIQIFPPIGESIFTVFTVVTNPLILAHYYLGGGPYNTGGDGGFECDDSGCCGSGGDWGGVS